MPVKKGINPQNNIAMSTPVNMGPNYMNNHIPNINQQNMGISYQQGNINPNVNKDPINFMNLGMNMNIPTNHNMSIPMMNNNMTIPTYNNNMNMPGHSMGINQTKMNQPMNMNYQSMNTQPMNNINQQKQPYVSKNP